MVSSAQYLICSMKSTGAGTGAGVGACACAECSGQCAVCSVLPVTGEELSV